MERRKKERDREWSRSRSYSPCRAVPSRALPRRAPPRLAWPSTRIVAHKFDSSSMACCGLVQSGFVVNLRQGDDRRYTPTSVGEVGGLPPDGCRMHHGGQRPPEFPNGHLLFVLPRHAFKCTLVYVLGATPADTP